MKKTLVAYFSCTGRTERVAKTLAETIGADLYQIVPEKPYSDADLNWMEKTSRCNLEMQDESSRPGIRDRARGMEEYQTVFLGFPIWWYVEPRIVDTFLERYDFSGKTIVPFATSGGSGLGRTEELLKSRCVCARWGKGKVWNGPVSAEALLAWAKPFL